MAKALAYIAASAFLVLCYTLPSIVAVRRGHRRQQSIIALDLILGWTLVGWIAALVWSLTSNVKNKRRKR